MPSAVSHRSSRPGRIQAAYVVSALAVLISVALTVGMGTSAGAQDASPSPQASADPTAMPEGFTAKMVKKVEEIASQVQPVRQLPAAEDVTYRVIDAETFRTELEALFLKEYPPEHIAAEDDLYTRLGLIGPDEDLEELLLSLYEAQVLAFYDPATDTFSLVGPITKISPLESVVVAHEYGHALQDQRWDLEGTRITDLSRSDAILAQQALAEGDATAIMYDWAARELKLRQLLRVSGEALTKQDERMMRRIPTILRRQLEFPYIDGYAFVNALRGRGDWSAVDEAWQARPESTEQILHPEKYPNEVPVEIELPDLAALLGEGWRTSYLQTLGEMQIGVFVADDRKAKKLFPKLPGLLPKRGAAAGWGGDRLASLDGPDGAWAVVWQTDWDSDKDANEFRKAASDAMKDLPGAHAVVDADVVGGLSSPVLVLVADGRETLRDTRNALALDS